MKEVLVTGGAGFIGAYVCRDLARNGYLPITADNLSTGYRHNVKWGPLYELDLRDDGALRRVLRERDIYGVLHLAASAYVEESQREPLKYFENNIESTLSVLNSVEHFGIRNLVFSSSCSVYGAGTGKPFNENSPKEPCNNYGISKKICEDLLTIVAKKLEIDIAILRFFNACGGDSDLEIFEEHAPETHVIPLLVRAAFDTSKTFRIYGKNLNTLDGTPVRDFVHVKDLAYAHVLALNHVSDTKTSLSINLGSGQGTSILELVTVIREMGFSPKIEYLPKREGDPASLVADIDSAKELLGWNPVNSSIHEILDSSIKAFSVNHRSRQ